MDVSFVIPARNEQDTLSHTVANLHATVPGHSFEVIVVDDQSEDDLSRHLEPRSNLVCVRNAERLGVAKSRNIGARRASGDLLVFLDAHVAFAPGWLDELTRHRDFLAGGIVAPATFSIFDSGQFRVLAADRTVPWRVRLRGGHGTRFYGYSMTPLPTPQTVPNFRKRGNGAFTVPIVGSAALAVTRRLFFELGAFEDELTGFGGHEDAELCMRCWLYGHTVAVVPGVSCFHYRPRRTHRIDYRAAPFHLEYYEGSVENALRLFYLHLPREEFTELVDRYSHVPRFAPDLTLLLTDSLEERRRTLSNRRLHDYRWLLRRMSRV